MGNPHDLNDEQIVVKLTDHTVVPDPIAPQTTEIPGEGFAPHSWVRKVTRFSVVGSDPFLPDVVDLAELFQCR